jgi:hypothetical protein
MSLSY